MWPTKKHPSFDIWEDKRGSGLQPNNTFPFHLILSGLDETDAPGCYHVHDGQFSIWIGASASPFWRIGVHVQDGNANLPLGEFYRLNQLKALCHWQVEIFNESDKSKRHELEGKLVREKKPFLNSKLSTGKMDLPDGYYQYEGDF